MNSPPFAQGTNQQFVGPRGPGNPAQCQNQMQAFSSPPFRPRGPNFPASPGNWNAPPFTQPPPGNTSPFNQPPPPCFPPGAPPQAPHCPPPRHGRPVNNVWCDPSLYQPKFGPPPRMCPPGASPQQHRGQFGPPGRGRGGGGSGRGRGGGARGGGGRNHPQNNHGNKSGNNNRHGQSSKKVKTDKRDLPENNKFHCETCDRGFKTEEKYQQHVLEHKQCTVDGCRYVAAPKLVELHYHTQHRTGLAKKIWSLESPEDIQKWIEERKRNFPTKENITKKIKEAVERRSRGEWIDTKQFGKMRGRGRDRRGRFGRQHQWENGRSQDSSSEQHSGSLHRMPHTDQDSTTDRLNHSGSFSHSSAGQNQPSSASSDQSAEVCNQGSSRDPVQNSSKKSQERNMNHKRPFPQAERNRQPDAHLTSPQGAKKSKVDENQSTKDGTEVKTNKGPGDDVDPLSLLIKGEDSMSAEDESENEEDAKPQMLRGQGLASLISSYGSDSGEEEDDKDNDDAVNQTVRVDGEAALLPAKSVTQASAPPPTETLRGDHEQQHTASRLQPASRDVSKKRKHQQGRQPQPPKKPTLLEMLLAKEIRHERNVIMQCVHYIVKNKFLGLCDGKP